MNSQHRAIRALLSTMGTRRATDFIQAFRLPEIEEICILEGREIGGLSYQQICDKHHLTPEVVKEARRRAFVKIADDIEYLHEKSRGG